MSDQMPATQVRSVHPYGYRSGEWAQIVGRYDNEDVGRTCMLLVWPDGSTDEWPVEDPSDEREYRCDLPPTSEREA